MENNNSTQIVTFSGNFINYLKNKEIMNELKKLIVIEQQCCCGHDDYDVEHDDPDDEHHNCNSEKIINTLVKLCETDGKITPRNTVEKLESLLMDSELSPNSCFFSRYISCLACSCRDHNNDIDESYIQTAVDKLRIIMENMEDSDNEFFIENYIFCLSELSKKQEPVKAKKTIDEIKTISDETNAWENTENINRYCLALMYLCGKQSDALDLQGLYETTETLENIVNNYGDTDDLSMFICYSHALQRLCANSNVSVSETYNFTQRLENLVEHTQQMDNNSIVVSYMLGLAELISKQREQSLCCKKTFERARSIVENARYKSNDMIVACYAQNLINQIDESDIDNVKFTVNKLSELAKRPHLKENDYFNEHYNRIKQLHLNSI